MQARKNLGLPYTYPERKLWHIFENVTSNSGGGQVEDVFLEEGKKYIVRTENESGVLEEMEWECKKISWGVSQDEYFVCASARAAAARYTRVSQMYGTDGTNKYVRVSSDMEYDFDGPFTVTVYELGDDIAVPIEERFIPDAFAKKDEVSNDFNSHNISEESHNDIRLLVEGLSSRLNALADSDDTTLDQLSEIVAYIKSNKDLIDAITTSKVNVTDIIDSLTTAVSDKPLSAKQGAVLNALINSVSGGLSAHIKDTSMHMTADAIDQKITNKIAESLLQSIYPVGSIYMSANNVSPATLFGGTWEQIKDTFLLSAGDTYKAGETGGESTHILTIDELPKHSHGVKTDLDSPDFNVEWPAWSEHTYGWTQTEEISNAPAAQTTIVGKNTAHNNMPPYLAVYVWKRIA
jgi:hypothetical protein